jgi:hypothetical protein
VTPARVAGAGAAGAVGAVLGGLVALGGCADDGGPRLAAVTPAAARRGATVTLTGSRLCGIHADCAGAAGAVELGLDPPMVRAIVIGYDDTAAQILIPDAAPVGPTAVIVTVAERSSNALDFEVLP